MARRILIADDHAAIRRGLSSLLEDAGWRVVGEATNGKEAVEKTEQLKPDLIILDITMPVMRGFDAAREILKSHPGVKILIFSMHESEQIQERSVPGRGAWLRHKIRSLRTADQQREGRSRLLSFDFPWPHTASGAGFTTLGQRGR